MKFRVERDVLADAVSWVARTLPHRPAIPVLAGVRIHAEGAEVILSSFDYDTSARTVVEAAIEDPGDVLVSGRLLADICKALPKRPVDVELVGSKVSISCGSSHFSVASMAVDDYPDLPQMPAATGKINADDFQLAVNQVALASSREDTLPLLTTVRIEVEGNQLVLLATDRYRLAMRQIEWEPTDPSVSCAALVKARTLTDMTKSLAAGSEVAVALATDAGAASIIGVEAAGRRMTSNLTDGDYPAVRSLFPTDAGIHATIDRQALINAAKRVALVVNRDDPIRLSFSEGQLVLEAGQGENAQASEALVAAFEGDDELVTAFNPAFLLDGLSALESTYVRMSFTAASKPAVLTGQEEIGGEEDTTYRYLLMPVRYGL